MISSYEIELSVYLRKRHGAKFILSVECTAYIYEVKAVSYATAITHFKRRDGEGKIEECRIIKFESEKELLDYFLHTKPG
jgi:hypothetical protein